MNITVTGRHVDITDTLRDHVQARLTDALSEFPRMDSVHVILTLEKYRQIAEVVAHVPRHGPVEASAESTDMYASIDAAADKTAAQVRKWFDKVHNHKNGPGLSEVDRTVQKAQGNA